MEKIQFLSDIHLEEPKNKIYFEEHLFSVEAEYLIIAGDLCEWKNIEENEWFYEWCSKHYKQTFIIFGNHDYYDCPNVLLKQYSYRFDIKPNVCYINNKSVIINDTEIFFSSLWSKLDEKYFDILDNIREMYRTPYMEESFQHQYKQIDDSNENEIQSHIKYDLNQEEYKNELKIIQNENNQKQMTFEQYNYCHEISTHWLQQAVSQSKAKFKIVATHYCPTQSLEKPQDEYYSVFRSNDEYLFNGVTLWIYGHTHRYLQPTFINETLIVSNQYGHENSSHVGFNESVTTHSFIDLLFK